MAVVLGSGFAPAAAALGPPMPRSRSPTSAASRRPRWPATSAVVRSLTIGGRRVLVFLGRVHLYEGHPAAGRGARGPDRDRGRGQVVVLTNAAGGINAATGSASRC